MNGGAALHAKVGDTVHILSFVNLTPEEAETYQPTLVFTEGNNQIKSVEKYDY
jgi:aspartate 1-decarboxylase